MSTTESTATEAPTRVCPHCATQSQTSGEFCPHCGGRFSKRQRSKKARVLLVAIPLVLILAGAGVAAALIIHHNSQVAAQKRARERRQQAQQQLAQQQQQLNQDLASTERSAIISSLEASVKNDAEKDVNDGTLNGPIMSVNCQPATAADSSASIANYSCMAVTSTSSDGTEQGYRFSATVNVPAGTYTWHLGG